MDNPLVSLDVDNGVRSGWVTEGCDSDLEGVIRYNSSSQKLEFCDGVDWIETGGG